MQYKINLKAGKEYRQEMTGTTFILLSTGAATELDIKIEIHGFEVETMRGVRRGFKLRSPRFTSASFLSAVDCAIEVITSLADITVNPQALDGNSVNATIIGTPAVSISGTPTVVTSRGGASATPMYIQGPKAATLTDSAAVAVTDVAVVLVTASTNRIGLRFTNLGAYPVALGAAGITWAKRCLVLNAGDTYLEDTAANLAWSAIADAGKTASVTIQQVIA